MGALSNTGRANNGDLSAAGWGQGAEGSPPPDGMLRS